MKTPTKSIFLFIGILLFMFTACQEEVHEETQPNDTETIQPNSNLETLMRNTSANDGSVDDILDGSDCFTVNLSVTIVANGVTLTIETLDDLSLLETIFNASGTDEDSVDFLFPIVIILNDYTAVDIESVEELNNFIDTCTANEDIIQCADFVYPITFSIYNTSFQIIDTEIIDNDYELYIFLQGLEAGTDGAILASLNFPVSVSYSNGRVVEVDNNQALEDALNAASNNCESSCVEDDVLINLLTCQWNIVSYDNTDEYIGYDVFFDGLGNVQFVDGDTTVAIGGLWSLSTVDGAVYVTFSEFTAFSEDLNGTWLVTVCEGDRLILTQEINGASVEMILEQICVSNPFDCFESQTITVCDTDNDQFEVLDLETLILGTVICEDTFTASFYETYADAEVNVNPISQPDNYTIITNPQTIYLRIETVSGNFQVYEITIALENCNPCENPGILTNDLIIYMPFGNEVRELISDYVVPGFTYLTEDRAGNQACAVAFDGSVNLSVPVTAQNQLVQGDDFSVSIWFKMQNESAGNFETIFQKGSANSEGFQMAVYDLNTPLVSDTTSGYGLWDNDWNNEVDVVWTNTDWHHFVLTRDANNTIRLYRDGELRNMDENSNFDIDTDPLSNYILGQFFIGHLDDLRVYKRTLTSDEVNELYTLEADCFQCF
ncbi:LamG domain-containing protein [Bizionia sp. KMM 8389]